MSSLNVFQRVRTSRSQQKRLGIIIRWIIAIILIAFAIWPWIQYGLVRAYGVDPWKLMGFAMYCIPGPMKTVRVYEVSADGRHRMLDARHVAVGVE